LPHRLRRWYHPFMAMIDELPLAVRLFMRSYPFARYAVDPVPSAPLRGPLSGARVALVTTAALYAPGQVPFDLTVRTGDTSFREIPGDVDVSSLAEGHKSKSWDHAGVGADRNLAFPLDRFRELERDGVIGSLNGRHLSFMGSVVGPRELIAESAPRAARLLREDGVDAVFLTPV
jgi:D-proline reductase (dithiol) PrdB